MHTYMHSDVLFTYTVHDPTQGEGEGWRDSHTRSFQIFMRCKVPGRKRNPNLLYLPLLGFLLTRTIHVLHTVLVGVIWSYRLFLALQFFYKMRRGEYKEASAAFSKTLEVPGGAVGLLPAPPHLQPPPFWLPSPPPPISLFWYDAKLCFARSPFDFVAQFAWIHMYNIIFAVLIYVCMHVLKVLNFEKGVWWNNTTFDQIIKRL